MTLKLVSFVFTAVRWLVYTETFNMGFKKLNILCEDAKVRIFYIRFLSLIFSVGIDWLVRHKVKIFQINFMFCPRRNVDELVADNMGVIMFNSRL